MPKKSPSPGRKTRGRERQSYRRDAELCLIKPGEDLEAIAQAIRDSQAEFDRLIGRHPQLPPKD